MNERITSPASTQTDLRHNPLLDSVMLSTTLHPYCMLCGCDAELTGCDCAGAIVAAANDTIWPSDLEPYHVIHVEA